MLKNNDQMLDRLEALQRRVSLTPGEKIEVEMLLKEKWRPKQWSCHSPEGSIGGAIGVPNLQRGEDVLNEPTEGLPVGSVGDYWDATAGRWRPQELEGNG